MNVHKNTSSSDNGLVTIYLLVRISSRTHATCKALENRPGDYQHLHLYRCQKLTGKITQNRLQSVNVEHMNKLNNLQQLTTYIHSFDNILLNQLQKQLLS